MVYKVHTFNTDYAIDVTPYGCLVLCLILYDFTLFNTKLNLAEYMHTLAT